MGRIIAVNLAHWRKRQQKRTQQRAWNDSLEYPGNVEENIEMANEGYTSYINNNNDNDDNYDDDDDDDDDDSDKLNNLPTTESVNP